MSVTTGRVLKYALLPGILPRAKDLFSSGFYHLAAFVASVYGTLRLLPPNHPYLNPRNFGKFGVRHVVAEAHRRLVFDREHTDQILIHFTIVAGIIGLFAQFILFFVTILIEPVWAQDYGVILANYFVTPNPETDVAFMMLDATFGLPHMFSSSLAPEPNAVSGFHLALHAFFRFYNTGILAVGLIIFLYFATTLIGETAAYGTPFGKRFNHFWAPVRLIIAAGLLTPLPAFEGGPPSFNGAQFLTLSVARWGSSFATNGWSTFIAKLVEENATPAGAVDRLVVTPKAQGITPLVQFMYMAQVCRHAERATRSRDVRAYIVRHHPTSDRLPLTPGFAMDGGPTFQEALDFMGNQDIIVRFGHVQTGANHPGDVVPTCGEVTIDLKDISTPGARTLQREYYELLRQMWTDQSSDDLAAELVAYAVPQAHRPDAELADGEYVQATLDFFQLGITRAINAAIADQAADPRWLEYLTNCGWGCAATWYNKIAEMNGPMIAAAFALPLPSLFPQACVEISDAKAARGEASTAIGRCKPFLNDGSRVSTRTNAETVAGVLYLAQKLWNKVEREKSGNSFKAAINTLLGLEGLFDMRGNRQVHPIAQLVGIGRSLIESSIYNFTFAGLSGGLSMFISGRPEGGLAKSFSSFSLSIGLTGLSVGVLLFYIIPFMPFMYFFFALGGWVKGLFEAMVGVPLWALAHIQIDGEGLPGKTANNGYFLILEIFLRPTLVVVGLIGSVMIFAAQVDILYVLWQDELIFENLTGHGEPGGMLLGALDNFFYLILYTIIVYMLALSSFKLIDSIPNHILRWIGENVPTFGEQGGDPLQGVSRYVYFGINAITNRLEGSTGLGLILD